jgi:hypothetical protein
MISRLGVAPHIVEAILGHADGHKRGVAGVYNRATYENEKRIALNRWADYLLASGGRGLRADSCAVARLSDV